VWDGSHRKPSTPSYSADRRWAEPGVSYLVPVQSVSKKGTEKRRARQEAGYVKKGHSIHQTQVPFVGKGRKKKKVFE